MWNEHFSVKIQRILNCQKNTYSLKFNSRMSINKCSVSKHQVLQLKYNGGAYPRCKVIWSMGLLYIFELFDSKVKLCGKLHCWILQYTFPQNDSSFKLCFLNFATYISKVSVPEEAQSQRENSKLTYNNNLDNLRKRS